MTFTTPSQILDIVSKIKEAIDASAEGATSVASGLGQLYKGFISKDELNDASYMSSLEDTGIRFVRLTGTKNLAQAVSLKITYISVCTVEILVGSFKISDDGLTVSSPAVSDFGKMPVVNIAVRFNITVNLFGNSSLQKGLSTWKMMTLADYSGFREPSASGARV